MNKHLRSHRSLALPTAAALLNFLSGCGSSSDDGGTPGGGGGGTVALETLSGLVRTAGGAPLQGVTVTAGSASALTDPTGAFILSSVGSLPVGGVIVEFDGSTAVATGPLDYPTLDVVVPLPAGTTALTMPQVITLPDLNNPVSANQNVALNADGSASVAVDVVQAMGMTDISLSGPVGTVITIGGMVGAVGVDLNVTPVASEEVPMPLPDGLLGNSFVTIQPGNAAFDPPDPAPPGAPVLGLDIVIPDSLDLAPGTVVDIWSFDHEAGEWVNRTLETGQTGMVQLVGGVGPGTEIVASGVITEGGWHTGVISVDPDCATTIQGSVIDQGSGEGIAGATIAFSTGQFAMTGSDGSFTSDLIPAYDVALLAGGGACVPVEVCYEVVLPPCAGGLTSGKLTVAAGDIVAGGTTTLAATVFMLGTTGSVAGVVIGDGAPGEMVVLTPSAGSPVSVMPSAGGSFFSTGLEAGDWTAEFLFMGEMMPTLAPFVVEANAIASVTIQLAKGGGSDNITVLVLQDDDDDNTPLVPCPGATVRLQGTDAVSAGGLVMVTGMDGTALFNSVSGPFSVTAQKDIFAQAVTTRFATSLVGIEPASGTIGMLLQVEVPGTPPVVDPVLSGMVLNLPMLVGTEVLRVTAIESGTGGDGFSGTAFVDPGTGAFALQIPADTMVDVVVTHRDELATSKILATLLLPGAGQAASGGTLDVNPDFANAVVWDQAVDFTFANASAGNDAFIEVALEDGSTGTAFEFDLHLSMGTQNVTLNLPDVTDAAFASYRFLAGAFTFDSMGFGSGQECELLLTATPVTLALEFITPSVVTSPMNGASFTVADLEALNVTYVEGSTGSFGTNGANSFLLLYEPGGTGTPPAGIDAAFWNVFVPAGEQAFDLPLAGLPMFGPGQGAILTDLNVFRFAGPTFDYDTFFDEDLQMNFDALLNGTTAECESFTLGSISTQ